MDALSLEELTSLCRSTGGPHVSIYMPTVRFGPDSQIENGRRLKNLLKIAAEELDSRGVRPREIDTLLAPARVIIEDRPFWLRAGDGLAIFLGPQTAAFRLPGKFPEIVAVSEHYYIKPLLTHLGSDRHFFVLALSLKRVQLLRGTIESLVPVDVTGAPSSLSEALKWDDFEKRSLQFHTQTSLAAGGRRPVVFHGSGEPDPKEEILRYFRGIDRALRDVVPPDTPLILAGVDYLLPLYREVSGVPSLVDESIVGNPDSLGLESLHDQAWAIAQAVFDEEREQAARRIEEAWATPRVTPDPERIVPAAFQARVDVMFVALDREVWGKVLDEAGDVEIHERPEPGDEDLLDRAAVQTLLSGGTVFAVPAEKTPRGYPAVALLRY